MWINSPLGKWDQDALVEKALGDAERRRMVEVGRGARKEYRISELLSSAKFRAWAGSRPPFIEPRIPRGRGW
jgi:hypothetical protein